MTLAEVMKELEELGSEQTKKIFARHGAREPFFGVKVADLKKLLKRVKGQHELALKLYDTGNSDAMYLAGLLADGAQITKEQLQHWVERAYWYMLAEYTVPHLAAETPYGPELAIEWIESPHEMIASAGWALLANLAIMRDDSELGIQLYEGLLERVEHEIAAAPNRVRYTMNGFIIAVGSYLLPLRERALDVAGRVGKVSVDMGGTSCKVPLASEYIRKVIDKGGLLKKRKSLR